HLPETGGVDLEFGVVHSFVNTITAVFFWYVSGVYGIGFNLRRSTCVRADKALPGSHRDRALTSFVTRVFQDIREVTRRGAAFLNRHDVMRTVCAKPQAAVRRHGEVRPRTPGVIVGICGFYADIDVDFGDTGHVFGYYPG